MIKQMMDEIKKRLSNLILHRYTGKIDFEVNMFEGGISNMNIGTKESWKPQPGKKGGAK